MIIYRQRRSIYVFIMAKILIVYASFGEGHKRGAQALKYLPGACFCDLLNFTHPILRKIYSSGYLAVAQYFPGIWKGLFFYTKKNFFSSWVDKINRKIFASFLKYLKDTRPEIIIVTHFFPSSLIADIKGELNFKVISVITDLRVHSLWVSDCIDHYFAALEVTKRDLIGLGVASDKITAGYVPLREGFLKGISPESVRKKFALDLKPVLIFVSSLRGKSSYLKKSIRILSKDFNIFLIYGKNKRLKRYLEGLNSSCIRFFPFYDEIWELFLASSVIIAKPGGMTVFEGLYMRKPFIFTHYIPGQEEENMEVLIKHDIAKLVRGQKELIEAAYYYSSKANWLRGNYPLEVKDIGKPLSDLIERWSNA